MTRDNKRNAKQTSTARECVHGEPDSLGARVAVGAGLPHLLHVTRDLPREGQFAAWQAICGPFVEVLRPRDAEAGYEATARIWKLGRLSLVHVAAPAASYRRTASQIRQDGMNDWLVGLVLKGRQRLRIEGRPAEIRRGVPYFFSLAQPIDSEFGTIALLCLVVPRGMLGERATTIASHGDGPLDGPVGELLAGTLRSLFEQLPNMRMMDAPGMQAALLALVGATLAACRHHAGSTTDRIEEVHRARAMAIIRQKLREVDLSPALVCQLSGMSRSQLYRIFAPVGGVARAIHAERLRRLYSELVRSGGTAEVGRLGEALGFRDPSTLTRSFRRAYGCTPSSLLAQVAASAGSPLPDADAARRIPSPGASQRKRGRTTRPKAAP